MVDLTFTSIPTWASSPGAVRMVPPTGGTAYVVVGVGSGQAAARWWAEFLPETTLFTADDVDEAARGLAGILSRARVGVRVALTGPAGDCLRLRAVALDAGAEDDELHIQATEAGAADVFCAHCATATRTMVGVGGVVRCAGCGRDLVVYHHVSRRSGQYLGYQVDAETLPGETLPADGALEVASW